MPSLTAARKELKLATQARARMIKATNLMELDAAWKESIRSLERCWNKTCAEMKSNAKWQGWKGRGDIEGVRSGDSLLSYLRNARGADEHGIAEITTVTPGSVGINPAEGNSLHIDRLTIHNGRITELKSPQRVKITFDPGKFTLNPVVNRGRTYAVPTEHLGKQLEKVDPVTLISFGIEFYASALKRIDTEWP